MSVASPVVDESGRNPASFRSRFRLAAARSIAGTNTKLLCPFAVAVDAAGAIYPADVNGVSTFAASAPGNVAPIRGLTFLGNETEDGLNLEEIAIGPVPVNAASTSARRGLRGPAMPFAAMRRSPRPGTLHRDGGSICIAERNARRAALAKLVPRGHALPPGRYRSPLCR